MNNVVENRIVQMVFDNKKFESGISQSVKSLSNLDKNLKNIDSNAKALGGLGSVFSGLGANVESLNSKFSAWGVAGMSAIQNITDRIVNGLMGALAGIKNQLDSLTFDQINAGFGKFEEKAEAVATIVAAVSSQGKGIEDVDKAMERLNWFTDETSYNFTDMASNIGKFTANNIDLDIATEAMEGIATWAALSGQNAQSASRAMYNLSQAIGVGAVKLMDWNSIENANMATTEFKQTALDTAVALGTLTKSGEGMDAVYKTLAGHEFTLTQFNTQLSDAWFNSDVLLKTLNKYGGFTTGLNKLYDAISDAGYTTTKIVEEGGLLDQYTKKTLDLNELHEKTGVSTKELTELFDYLTDSEQALGRKAFLAGQEARTLTAALDATKDAASTMWMNIFEKMFGNVENAKVIWTNFCSFLYDTLVEPLNDIYDEVANFVDSGGMKQLRSGFKGFGKGIIDLGNSIRGVFTGDLANWMLKVADGFQGFGNRFASIMHRISSEEDGNGAIAKIVESFKTLFSYVKEIAAPIERAFNAIFPKKTMKESADAIGVFADKFANFVATLKPSESLLNRIQKIFETLFSVIKKGIDIIRNFASSLSPLWSVFKNLVGLFVDAAAGVSDFVSEIFNSESTVGGFAGIVQGVANALQWVIDKLRSFSMSDAWHGFINMLQTIWQKIKEFAVNVKETFSKIDFGGLIGIGKLGAEVGITILLKNLIEKVKDLKSLKLSEIITGAKDSLIGFIDDIKGALSNGKTTVINGLKEFAVAIGILTASLLVLSFINMDNASTALLSMIGIMSVLVTGFAVASKYIKPESIKAILSLSAGLLSAATAILLVASAMAVLSVAFAAFTLISKSASAFDGLIAMAGTMTIVAVALKTLAENCNSGELLAAGAAILVVATSLLIMSAAFAVFAAVITLAGDNVATIIMSLVISLGAVALVLRTLAENCNSGELLAAAAAILIVSAALVVLTAAVGGMALILSTGTGVAGAATIMVMIAALVIALKSLAAAGPIVLSAAGSIAVFSAALLALAIAVGVASVALVALGAGLTALGIGIAAFVAGVSASILALVGGIVGSISLAVKLIASAIEDIFASIGKGIGKGLSAIGDGITELSEGITDFSISIGDVGDGIARFGDGVRSLEGIKWLELAIGIDKITDAIKKLNKNPIKIDISALKDFISTVNGNSVIFDYEALTEQLNQLNASTATANQELASVGASVSSAAASLSAPLNIMILDFEKILDRFKQKFMSFTRFISMEWGHLMNDLRGQNESTFSELIQKATAACEEAITQLQLVYDKVTEIRQGLSEMTDASNLLGGEGTDGGQQATAFVSALVSSIKSMAGDFQAAGTAAGNALANGIKATSSSSISEVAAIVSGAVSELSSMPGEFHSAGVSAGEGAAAGIRSMTGAVAAAARALAQAANSAYRGALRINSPSKVFMESSYSIPEGVAKGIKKKTYLATDAVKDMSKKLLHTGSRLSDKITDIINSSDDMTITPVLDLSHVRKDAATIGELFNANYSRVLVSDIAADDAKFRANIQNGANSNGNTFNNTTNIYPREMDKATMDYVISAVNRRLGARV